MEQARTTWKIDLHPAFAAVMEEVDISEGGVIVLESVINTLRDCAGNLKPHRMAGRVLRIFHSRRTYLVDEGRLVLPPVNVYYEMSADGTTALIMMAWELPPDETDLVVCGETFTDAVRKDLKAVAAAGG